MDGNTTPTNLALVDQMMKEGLWARRASQWTWDREHTGGIMAALVASSWGHNLDGEVE